MKIKRADRLDWERITQRRFVQTYIEDNVFRGHMTMLCMDKVREPLWVNCAGQDICIVDNGYSWTQHFPEGKQYAVTTAFDEQGEVVQWYIDICKSHCVDEQGHVWYEDLYLDIVLLTSGESELLDVEELDEALREGKVSSMEYDLAWHEADAVMLAIEEDMFPLLWSVGEHRDKLLALLRP